MPILMNCFWNPTFKTVVKFVQMDIYNELTYLNRINFNFLQNMAEI